MRVVQGTIFSIFSLTASLGTGQAIAISIDTDLENAGRRDVAGGHWPPTRPAANRSVLASIQGAGPAIGVHPGLKVLLCSDTSILSTYRESAMATPSSNVARIIER